jgi:hypothetical protein
MKYSSHRIHTITTELGADIPMSTEDRGLLCAGQDLDEVGHPAYLLPTRRQYLSSEHKSDSSTLNYLLF